MTGALLSKTLEQSRHVHLIGLIISGQGVHNYVDAGAISKFALVLASRRNGQESSAVCVNGPGGGIVVGADDDRRHAISGGVLLTLRFDPKLTLVRSAGKG